MIERFIQILFWLRIWISPTLIGGILGVLSYISLPSPFGLFIGIFSFAGYNYLVSQVDKAINKMEMTATDFMDLLQEPTA